MEEQFISLKTAKLLKEKEFDLLLPNYYYQEPSENFAWELCTSSMLKYSNSHRGKIVAPTQSLLQKWLREKHKLHIEILLSENAPYDTYYSRVSEIGKYFTTAHDDFYGTYEEALEKGLQEALKLI